MLERNWLVDVLITRVALAGGVLRVRRGRNSSWSRTSNSMVLVARVLEVHLPSAQVGVVLPGAVRAGTEVVTSRGARDPMLL